MRVRQLTSLLVALLVVGGAGAAFARGGFVLGLDLGGAAVRGDQNVPLKDFDCPSEAFCKDSVRTDATSGFAFGLRLGYNVLGFGALEGHMWGSGNLSSGGDKPEGAVYSAIVARYFPLQHVKKWYYRKFDPSIYLGWQPVAYMGYYTQDKFGNEGRGWTSRTGWQFGASCDYELKRGVFVGLDLRFHRPSYKLYYVRWEEPQIKSEPKSIPSTLVFAPLLRVTVRFGDLDPDGKIVGATRGGSSSRPQSGTGDDYYEW